MNVTENLETDAPLRLRHSIEAQIVAPGDDDYDAARMACNLSVQQCPALSVSAESVGRGQAAVKYANSSGLKVAVQATGRGIPKTFDAGMLIQVGHLNGVILDADRSPALVGGEAKWGDV